MVGFLRSGALLAGLILAGLVGTGQVQAAPLTEVGSIPLGDVKGPIAVAPLFLHRNEGIAALTVICLAVLILSLIELEIPRKSSPTPHRRLPRLRLRAMRPHRTTHPHRPVSHPTHPRSPQSTTPTHPTQQLQKQLLTLYLDPTRPRCRTECPRCAKSGSIAGLSALVSLFLVTPSHGTIAESKGGTMKVRRIAARVVAVGVLAGGIALGSAGVASADSGGGGFLPRHDDDHHSCAWHEGHTRWFDDDHHCRWFDDDHHSDRFSFFDDDFHNGHGW